MQVSRTARLKQSFVFTGHDLSKLHAAFSEFGDHVRYEVGCRDGLDRHFSDIEDVRNYDNPPPREITSIELKARSSDDLNQTARFELSNTSDENIWISFEGPEQACLELNTAIDDRLTGMKPWYGRLATTDFINVTFALYGAFLLGFLVAAAIGLIGPSESETPKNGSRSGQTGLILYLSMIVFPALIAFTMNHLRNRSFPVGVFAIGQGVQRHAQKEWTRRLMVGGIVSLGISLLILLISLLI